MKPAAKLPDVRVVDEAIGALGELFEALPRDKRSEHAGNQRDVLRVLRLVRDVVAAGVPAAGEAPAGPEPDEEPAAKGDGKASANGKGARETGEELPPKVRAVLDAVGRLSLDDRLVFLDALEGEFCRCGFAEPGDGHSCVYTEEDDDEDDDEDEDEEDETRASGEP